MTFIALVSALIYGHQNATSDAYDDSESFMDFSLFMQAVVVQAHVNDIVFMLENFCSEKCIVNDVNVFFSINFFFLKNIFSKLSENHVMVMN